MVANSTDIPFSNELLAELEPIAKKHGMTVPAYIAFLARAKVRGHDPEFVRAAKATFLKYPGALRKLSQ